MEPFCQVPVVSAALEAAMEFSSWYERQARLYCELAQNARTPAGRTHFLKLEQSFRQMDRLAHWLDGQISPFARTTRHADAELRQAA